jgi:type IV pilus assembly protein PilM
VAGRTTIGLDIGTSCVRAAELTYGKDGVRLEKFGQLAVPDGAVVDGEVLDPDAVSAALRRLWASTGFSSKKVVLGVANQRVVVRQVDLPWVPAKELQSTLGFHVQDYLPIPVDQAVLDFHPLEDTTVDGARTLRGLLVAASRSVVLANVRCAEQAGLRPTGVDLTPFAVLRSLGSRLGSEVTTEAVIDVGARITNIVVHSGGRPRFVRILLMGGQDITEAIAERLGVSFVEAEAVKQSIGTGRADVDPAAERAAEYATQAFVDEVRGSLTYYASANPDAPTERIVLSGGGSKLRMLPGHLGSATRLPVVFGDVVSALQIGRTGLDALQLDSIRPLAAVPVGLALGAAR